MLDINVSVQELNGNGVSGIFPNDISVGTKGSANVSQLIFHFSSAWQGLSKKITFYPSRQPSVVVVMVSDINPVIKLFVRFGVFDVFVIEERSNAIFG